MSDENKSDRSVLNQSGGVTINAQTVNITGDLTGRDGTKEGNAGGSAGAPPSLPESSTSRLFVGGLIGLVVGVAGYLFANLLWEGFIRQTPAWLKIVSILSMTVAGSLGSVWIKTRGKLMGLGAIMCGLAAIVVLIFAATALNASPTLTHTPIIQKVLASPSTVYVGKAATLTAIANDPDNDNLVFYWKAQKGSVPSGAQGDIVTYIAPSASGIDTIEVTVSDGQASVSQTIRVSILSQ